MRQRGKWLVVAITTVAVGCAGDAGPGFDAGGAEGGAAAHFVLTVGTPTPALLTPGCEAVVELRGTSSARPLVRLSVGPRAITRPVELSISETSAPWGHVGPAYEIEPSGLEFAEPVQIEFDLDSIDLPPGTRPESLRVGTVENGRWIPVERPAGSAGRSATMTAEPPRVVSARLRHLSPYGVVADPREVSGVGRRLEANGIVAETTDDVYARLFVSSTLVTLYIDGGAAGTTQLTLSGLPTDEDHVLYVDDHEDMRTITPADGGSATVDLDRTEPHQLWLQEQPSTIQIGGPSDACGTVGSWTDATTCTLSTDVADNVVLAQSGVTLDCDGHSITPPLKPPPAVGEVLAAQGAGILISKIHDVGVRECHVGRPGAGFGIGIWVYYTDGADISENVLVENVQGVVFQVSTGVVVHDNQVTDSWVSGIAIQDLASVTAENLPPPLPQVEVWGNTISQTADSKSTAIDVRGTPAKFINDAAGVATNGLPPITVHDNLVNGGGNAVTLANVLDADIQQNDLGGPERGLLILDGGWPSRFWHNNVTASMFGVVDVRQPASGGTLPPANYTYKEPPPDGSLPATTPIEVSWSDQGSWWGHSCAEGTLFAPGVDSNTTLVTDSFPYGTASGWRFGRSPGCVADWDGDTVPNEVDNCPDVANPGQGNLDGVDEGDACDESAPTAPVITSPLAGAVLRYGGVVVRGGAEVGSRVAVFAGLAFRGETRTDSEGRFELLISPPLGAGVYDLSATASDGHPNTSPRSDLVRIVIDLDAPPAPAILGPRTGDVLNESLPSVWGSAPVGTTVLLQDEGTRIAAGPASPGGEFALIPAGPLADGVHTLTATALTPAGVASPPSAPVVIALVAPSDTTSLAGARGKLAVTLIKDQPDPFDPGAGEICALATNVVVETANGIGGSSPNHAFDLRATWTIRNQASGEAVRTIQALLPVDAGEVGTAVSLNGSWAGEMDTGGSAAEGKYNYDLDVKFVRTWNGPGRGPRCNRDEDPLGTGAGASACIIDSLSIANGGSVTITDVDAELLALERANPRRLIGASDEVFERHRSLMARRAGEDPEQYKSEFETILSASSVRTCLNDSQTSAWRDLYYVSRGRLQVSWSRQFCVPEYIDLGVHYYGDDAYLAKSDWEAKSWSLVSRLFRFTDSDRLALSGQVDVPYEASGPAVRQWPIHKFLYSRYHAGLRVLRDYLHLTLHHSWYNPAAWGVTVSAGWSGDLAGAPSAATLSATDATTAALSHVGSTDAEADGPPVLALVVDHGVVDLCYGLHLAEGPDRWYYEVSATSGAILASSSEEVDYSGSISAPVGRPHEGASKTSRPVPYASIFQDAVLYDWSGTASGYAAYNAACFRGPRATAILSGGGRIGWTDYHGSYPDISPGTPGDLDWILALQPPPLLGHVWDMSPELRAFVASFEGGTDVDIGPGMSDVDRRRTEVNYLWNFARRYYDAPAHPVPQSAKVAFQYVVLGPGDEDINLVSSDCQDPREPALPPDGKGCCQGESRMTGRCSIIRCHESIGAVAHEITERRFRDAVLHEFDHLLAAEAYRAAALVIR